MSNSVILQVDESIKGLMEEIQSGITFSIENGMREVKDKVESVDNTTDMILRKFKNFDDLSCTGDQLRSLSEESKKTATIISSLESDISEIKQNNIIHEQIFAQISSNIELLVKDVIELNNRQNNLVSEIKNEVQGVLNNIEERNGDIKKNLNDILQKMLQAEDIQQEASDKLNSALSNLKTSIDEITKQIDQKTTKFEENIVKIFNFQDDFSRRYIENESIHQAFESKTSSQIEDISKSIEKIQASLDIIVNLVTPFWKKW